MEDLLLNLTLPPDLSKERWLVAGETTPELTDALTQRGAQVTTAARDELAALAQAPFTVVVCPRLFYAIRHPLLMLEGVCRQTTAYALLHTPVITSNEPRALLRWEDASQGWVANRIALARMARSAGFAHVQTFSESSEGIWLKASRQWPDKPSWGASTLTIYRTFNPVTGQTIFPRTGRRAFLALWVMGLPPTAARWDIRLCVGGFGVQPIHVAPVENEGIVQINAPLPPGLPTGSVAVRLWHQQQHAQEITIKIVEGSAW